MRFHGNGNHGDPGAEHLVQSHINAFNRLPHKTKPDSLRLDDHDPELKWLHAPVVENSPDIICHLPIIRGERSLERWAKILDGTNYMILESVSRSGELFQHFPRDRVSEADDMLHAATLINSSKLFVGTSSCMWAICDGLKKDALVDIGTGAHNSTPLYDRSDNTHDWTDQAVRGRIDRALG